jgi:hypothetical protein
VKLCTDIGQGKQWQDPKIVLIFFYDVHYLP